MNSAARSSSVPLVLLRAFVTNPMVPLALIPVFIGIGMFVQFSSGMGHDLSWLLFASGRLVDGADIYGRDLFEWNQPMILWVLAPPVMISDRFDLSIFTCARLYIAFLGSIGLLISGAIARYSLAEERPVVRRYLLAVMAYGLFILPGHSFGQREHLIAILLMPEFLLLSAHAGNWEVPRRWVALSGVAAGFAISIKPQYGVLVIAWEIYLLLRHRHVLFFVRRDLVMLVLVCLANATAVLVLAPGYLGHVVPLAVDAYWVYQSSLEQIVRVEHCVMLAASLLVLPLVWGRRDLREYALVLVLAASGFYAIALLQGTGWEYHFLPFEITLLTLAMLPLLRLVVGWRARLVQDDAELGWVWRGLAAMAVGLGALALLLWLPGAPKTALEKGGLWRIGRTMGHVAVLEAALVEHAAGGSVWAVSPSLVAIFPAVMHADVGWSSRFAGVFLPAVVARYERHDPDVPERLSAARVEEIERFVRDAAIEDLERRPPSLILIDRVKRRKVFDREPFDFLAFFLEDPRFGEIWSRYEPIGKVGRFEAAVLRDDSRD